MKNLDYFKFERNQYYYGKLLTEKDFTEEQKYMNDKRRLQNRFLHGTGVVAGLRTIAVDEKTISIEAGMALDFSGREILVNTPVKKPLSTIEGFTTVVEEQQSNYAYLCIEYDEKDSSLGHNAVSSGNQGGEINYNKAAEGYRLYLTDREPEEVEASKEIFYKERVILYEEEEIIITQEVPRFIPAGEMFETKLCIENRGYAREITFSLKEELECASYEKDKVLTMEVEPQIIEKYGKKEITYYCKALKLNGGKVFMRLNLGKSMISVNGRHTKPDKEKEIEIEILAETVYEKLEGLFFKNYMDDISRQNYQQGIYLARVYMMKTDKVYFINEIEQMPFAQYVYGSQYIMNKIGVLQDELKTLKQENENMINSSSTGKERESISSGLVTQRGSTVISLGFGGERNKIYFSGEILHDFGEMPIYVLTNIVGKNSKVSGATNIFDDEVEKVNVAVKTDPTKGSFTIGVRLLEDTTSTFVTVEWMIVADMNSKKDGIEPKIYIKPKLLDLKVRETYHLEAVCEGIVPTGILWNVKMKDGGEISKDGMYVAPNQAGVYEVEAICENQQDIRSSIYIIVRE